VRLMKMATEGHTRRELIRLTAAAAGLATTSRAQEANPHSKHPYITPEDDFKDVTRQPKVHEITDAERVAARLTAETWRCEVTADPFVEYPHTKVPAMVEKPLTLADGTALDLKTLMELGKKHEVHYFKAMQCLNIAQPLGQGLWTGVPLREVLKLCGKIQNMRRIYFWGYHFDDLKLRYKASVSYTQCMETPPGDLPVFLAYKLNGKPISPERGGPVRLVVPWSYGFKSMKWLQHIFVTNDARNWDSYSEGNNDPDAFMKTAAYVDQGSAKVTHGQPAVLTGQVISGPSGLRRVEYWLRKVGEKVTPLDDDAPELLAGPWKPCELDSPPDWSAILPAGVQTKQLIGFDSQTGKPLSWPLRYSSTGYTAVMRDLPKGRYEVRARAVDLNDYAQPEPRASQKAGKNAIQVWSFEVV
jgi:DMSO/TMAO reductase YedYZ molybdopterin-dependent catalytic subunit